MLAAWLTKALPSAVVCRVQKQPAYFVLQHRDKAYRRFVNFENPGLGVGEVDVAHVLCYLCNELILEKGVRYRIGLAPHGYKSISIFNRVLSNFVRHWTDGMWDTGRELHCWHIRAQDCEKRKTAQDAQKLAQPYYPVSEC